MTKLYRQYDKRWASFPYPRRPDNMANSGCGPTACAMCITSKKDVTPKQVAKYGVSKGYAIPNAGTTWAGITGMLKKFGMSVACHDNMTSFFKAMSTNGTVGVIIFRGGTKGGVTWTLGGHYVEIDDYKVKGGKHYLHVKDPGPRQHDGWYCYEKHMRGLICFLWTCKPPVVKKPSVKKKTKKKEPKLALPARGYFKKGDTGAKVVALQKYLDKHGFKPGKIDGIIGPMTIKAVCRFQKKHKLVVDGLFGKMCRKAM